MPTLRARLVLVLGDRLSAAVAMWGAGLVLNAQACATTPELSYAETGEDSGGSTPDAAGPSDANGGQDASGSDAADALGSQDASDGSVCKTGGKRCTGNAECCSKRCEDQNGMLKCQ